MANVLVERSSLEDIGNAIREKKSTNERHIPAELGDAIRSIPATSAELPELASPAGAADIATGKQAIGGNGQIINGTLMQLLDSELNPTIILNGASLTNEPQKLYVDLEGRLDGSSVQLYEDVPDALPENIVAGKNILGLVGTAKRIVSASGTITPAQDCTNLTLNTGIAGVQEVFVFADVTDPSALQNLTIFKSFAVKNAISFFESQSISFDKVNNVVGVSSYKATATQISSGTISAIFESDGAIIINGISANGPFFRAGQRYQWVAYCWDDVIPHHSNGGEQA